MKVQSEHDASGVLLTQHLPKGLELVSAGKGNEWTRCLVFDFQVMLSNNLPISLLI